MSRGKSGAGILRRSRRGQSGPALKALRAETLAAEPTAARGACFTTRATFPAVAKNPDPTLELTSLDGSTRTLNEWLTMFHLCLVVLPDRPETSAFLPVVEHIFEVFGDADCSTAICVPSTGPVARRVLGDSAQRSMVFVDPERALIETLGLESLPAFVHLRQDTTLVSAAEGWNLEKWQAVADELAAAMSWSVPRLGTAAAPLATTGWPVQ